MRKFLMVAAMALMAGTSAHASERLSFQINGKKVTVEIPTRCADIACIKVNIPGVDLGNLGNLGNLGGMKDEDVPPLPKLPEQQATVAPAATAAPAPALPAPPALNTVIVPEPQAGAPAPATAATLPPPPPSAVAPAPVVTAAAPTNPPPAATPAPVAAAAPTILPGKLMPVGVWQTEKNEGKVRIEQCGENLCGWSVEDKPGARSKQVLVNMKSTRDNLWNGQINDTRNGSSYTSKMSLRDANSLRVEGCAMGGMFCGGQTWTRVQ